MKGSKILKDRNLLRTAKRSVEQIKALQIPLNISKALKEDYLQSRLKNKRSRS